jgi:hypothetical protein
MIIAVAVSVLTEGAVEIPERCAEPCTFFPELRYTVT